MITLEEVGGQLSSGNEMSHSCLKLPEGKIGQARMVFKMFQIGMFYSAIKKLVLLRKQALNLARQGRGQVFWAHLSEDVRSNEWSSRSNGSKIKTSGICSMKMMFTVSRMHPIQTRKPISLIDVLKIDSKPTKSMNHHQSHWCFTTRKKVTVSYTIVIP